MKNLIKSLLATLMLMGFAVSVNAEGKNHFDCSQYSKEIDGKNDLFMEATSPKIRCVQYERKLTNNILGEWDHTKIDFYKLPSNFESYKSIGRQYSEAMGFYNFVVEYGLDFGLVKLKLFLIDFGFIESYAEIAYHMQYTREEIILARSEKFPYSNEVKKFLAKSPIFVSASR